MFQKTSPTPTTSLNREPATPLLAHTYTPVELIMTAKPVHKQMSTESRTKGSWTREKRVERKLHSCSKFSKKLRPLEELVISYLILIPNVWLRYATKNNNTISLPHHLTEMTNIGRESHVRQNKVEFHRSQSCTALSLSLCISTQCLHMQLIATQLNLNGAIQSPTPSLSQGLYKSAHVKVAPRCGGQYGIYNWG